MLPQRMKVEPLSVSSTRLCSMTERIKRRFSSAENGPKLSFPFFISCPFKEYSVMQSLSPEYHPVKGKAPRVDPPDLITNITKARLFVDIGE
jgi:hypothetical protein